MSDLLWVTVGRDASGDAAAPLTTLDGRDAGWLSLHRGSARPSRAARRGDPRVLDPAGAEAHVSLVLPPLDAPLAAFDDPAVQQARRAVLADAHPPDVVTTLLVDASHFAGALTLRRGPDAPRRLLDDPFTRVWPGRVLHVGAGVLGAVPLPCGPTIERHGSDRPWPWPSF